MTEPQTSCLVGFAEGWSTRLVALAEKNLSQPRRALLVSASEFLLQDASNLHGCRHSPAAIFVKVQHGRRFQLSLIEGTRSENSHERDLDRGLRSLIDCQSLAHLFMTHTALTWHASD